MTAPTQSATELQAQFLGFQAFLLYWLQEEIDGQRQGPAVIALLETAIHLAIADIGRDNTAALVQSTFRRVAAGPTLHYPS